MVKVKREEAISLKKIFSILIPLLLMCSPVRAEALESEYNIETGKMWGFPNYVVTFEVSDSDIAEIIRDKRGSNLVRFLNPGEVYVRATFYSGGEPVENYLYLFHVSGEPKGSNAVNRSTFAQEVLELVNAERARHHVRPLRIADDLNRYADIRAREIVNKFSHTRPNGENGVYIMPRGRYRGENLAAGAASPSAVVHQWMNSPGHRANILSADFEELGVGYCFDDDGQYRHYWVQLFRTQ